MKKLFVVGTMLVAAPFVSFAQTTATGTVDVGATTTVTTPATPAVNPGFVPGDFFYFLDNVGENLRLFFTFNPESKAKLHLQYASERVAEIDDVLKKQNAKLEDVASAQVNFNAQVEGAANIIKSEKDKGVDVSNLALELSDELDSSREELKQTFHDYQSNASQAESVIRAKIAAIIASGTASTTDAGQLHGLTQALESITKEKNHAVEAESSVDASVSEEESTFDEVMGSQKAAEKHLEKAMEIQAHLNEMADQFGGISASSEQLMRDAQAAIQRGDFEAAKNISKAAERVLEQAKEAQGDSEVRVNVSGTVRIEGDASSSIEGSLDVDHINNLESDIKNTEKVLDGLDR